MKVSFRNSYRGKPSGFEDMQFVEKNGKLELRRTQFSGIAAEIMNNQIGPLQSCILFSNPNGMLELVVCGIGKSVYNVTHSPWICGDDTKTMYIALAEETADDTDSIFIALKSFACDFFASGNLALDALLCTPNDEYEYDVDYQLLSSIWAHETQVLSNHICRDSNKLYMYYSPCKLFCKNGLQTIVDFFCKRGLTAKRDNIIIGDCTEELLIQACAENSFWHSISSKIKKIFLHNSKKRT